MKSLVHSFCAAVLMLVFSASLAGAAPSVLFDQSHGQRFLSGKSGPLDLSDFAAFLKEKNFAVASSSDLLTPERLSSVDVLVISGPFRPLSNDEVAAVTSFVEAGGGLAVMLHIAPPLGNLLHQLEVDFTNGTLREAHHVIDGNPLNFAVTDLANHPVTLDLEGFSVYGSWALRGTAPYVKSIAETSPQGWVDLDHDNRLSQADAVQKFSVMVAGELGQGRYVVIGDDALFQNQFFDEHNRQLALQMFDWLTFNR